MGILERLYNAYGTMEQYAAGIIPMKVPELFAHAGLEHVKAYPIGTFFSLSNLKNRRFFHFLTMFALKNTMTLRQFLHYFTLKKSFYAQKRVILQQKQ